MEKNLIFLFVSKQTAVWSQNFSREVKTSFESGSDPDSIEPVDTHRHSESGSRKTDMAIKNERKNGNFSCFEKLDVLSEGLGDMLWSLEILHAGLEGNVKHYFYQFFCIFRILAIKTWIRIPLWDLVWTQIQQKTWILGFNQFRP